MAADAHELILVGGGHAHVQVLRGLAMRPLAGARVTLVVDDPVAVYSGMVPGFVAGHYRRDELEIDVRPLARRAGAAVVVARATASPRANGASTSRAARRSITTRRPSTSARRSRASISRARATSRSRRVPIGRFVAAIDAAIARAVQQGRARVVVCGAGAGGVELAFALRARLTREGVRNAAIALLDAAPRVLSNLHARVATRVDREARARGIELRTSARVAAVEEGVLVLEDDERIPFDALIWATGAASQPLFAASALPTDAGGFVRVRPTLQVEGHDALFAAGDCARFEPDLAKAGVYAVRQGPLLDRNLRARVAGGVLRAYRPQRDFLVLLNLGDGAALGTKWGRAVAGRACSR